MARRLLTLASWAWLFGAACGAGPATEPAVALPATSLANSPGSDDEAGAVIIIFEAEIEDASQVIDYPAGWALSSLSLSAFGVRLTPGGQYYGGIITIASAPGYPAGASIRLSETPFVEWHRPNVDAIALAAEKLSTSPAKLQEDVSQGHFPWRITPESVAIEYLLTRDPQSGPLQLAGMTLEPGVLYVRMLGDGWAFELRLRPADPAAEYPAWFVDGGLAFETE